MSEPRADWFSGQLERQIAEMAANLGAPSAQYEAVQEVARSTTGEALQPLLRQMAGMNGVSGILARQQSALAAIAASFQPLPVPTARELREAEAALLRNLPETPEQVKQVEQLSETIAADPRQHELISRLRSTLGQADLSKVTPLALSALLYWWLCHVLSLPVTGEITPGQAADYLGVVTLILGVLVALRPRD